MTKLSDWTDWSLITNLSLMYIGIFAFQKFLSSHVLVIYIFLKNAYFIYIFKMIVITCLFYFLWFAIPHRAYTGFPAVSGVKNPPANAGDTGLIRGSRRVGHDWACMWHDPRAYTSSYLVLFTYTFSFLLLKTVRIATLDL